jgi:hypothetical protein
MAQLFEKRITAIVRTAVPREADVYLRREEGDACIYAEWTPAVGAPVKTRFRLARTEFAAYVAGSERHRELVDESMLLAVVEWMRGSPSDDYPPSAAAVIWPL